ncbi:snaclec salmorin subunit A-like [Ruditapes philippinarum]|uniref:snaclec salmorin subunit A-like n=1 Tax=Ruditapes philippinarum TaxID=129788 RepID=UPI00295B57FD|nr:snaclec salmorin subunit A-like [Ruditapes philippinarum]
MSTDHISAIKKMNRTVLLITLLVIVMIVVYCVLGIVIVNIENKYRTLKDENSKITDKLCRLSRCNDWTEWSQCETSMYGGRFGIQKRNRTCGGNTDTCYGSSSIDVQFESTICEQICPNQYQMYNYTYNWICLKIYVNLMNRSDAENTCRRDGGHLVNIDSEQKAKYIEKLLHNHSIDCGGIWIDGIRSEGSHEWRHNVQPTNPSFTYWDERQNEPNLNSGELCKVFYFGAISRLWRWHDAYCNRENKFLCEIIRQLN